MRKIAALLCLAFLCLAPASTLVVAQSAEPPAQQQRLDPRKLLVPRKSEPAQFTKDPIRWIAEQQRAYTKALAAELTSAKAKGTWYAAWGLIGISFLYGVLHAAGPGHGKVVIVTWLMATESELKRGLTIALMSSLLQAVTAVTIVGGTLLLLSGAAAAARQAAGLMESASFLMIAGLGLYLIATALRKLSFQRTPATVAAAAGAAPDFSGFQPLVNNHVHMTAEEAEQCGCGHAHAPTPAEVRGDWSWKRALGVSFSIGIRPCVGAIIILLLSYPLGLFGAGIAATFAMALGTFITIAAIAAIAVYARSLALKLADRNNKAAAALDMTLRLVGGLALVIMGAALFAASLTGTTAGNFT